MPPTGHLMVKDAVKSGKWSFFLAPNKKSPLWALYHPRHLIRLVDVPGIFTHSPSVRHLRPLAKQLRVIVPGFEGRWFWRGRHFCLAFCCLGYARTRRRGLSEPRHQLGMALGVWT